MQSYRSYCYFCSHPSAHRCWRSSSRMLRGGNLQRDFRDIQRRASRRRRQTVKRMMPDWKRGSAFATTKEDERHVSDFYYAVQISVYLLIDIWPLADDEATSRLKSAMHRAFTLTATFLFIFLIVPCILHVIKEKRNVVLILRMTCPLFFTVTIFARYILLMLHEERLKSCMDRATERCAIIGEDREITLANARMSHIVSIIMFGVLYYLLPLISSSLIKDNITIMRTHPSPCELLVFDFKVKYSVGWIAR